mmetsp:Transcript_41063/g.39565  ORF Transcript_41063/g.39565 Transcript_41063/m.39565 type:complete len:191 (+) Transcript_41063:467-1039(+)
MPATFEEAEFVYRQYISFKRLCDFHPFGIHGVLIELDSEVPNWEKFMKRWLSEQVVGLLLDVSIFVENNKHNPVLPKAHQSICKEFMKNNVRFVLRGKHPNDNLEGHYQYLCFLFRNHDKLDEEQKQEVSFRNYLQFPLQPLADNLESSTYEIFENDVIKYQIYEEALYEAFLDKKQYGRFFQRAPITEE